MCENSPISTDIADAEAMMQKNPTIKKKHPTYIYVMILVLISLGLQSFIEERFNPILMRACIYMYKSR